MPWRCYPKFNKFVRADGTVARYKSRCKKWLKSHKPYRPQKRGFEKQAIYSTRFGFLDLYTRKEQDALICPSGYNVHQCFGAMAKLWHGYHRARIDGEKLEQMEKYAKAIQDVQKDMGIKTTSFPHLGLYGDVFVLNNKHGERIVFEDHSSLKAQQDEYDKWAAEDAENAKKIQQELQRPDKAKQEELETFADEVGPSYIEERDDDEDEEEEPQVPDQLEPNEEEGETTITMSDDIPFTSDPWRIRSRRFP
jgi:hypothetical protein